MSNTVPNQHPAVVLRSHYRQLRSLLAIALVALVGLSTTVVVVAIDDGPTSTSFVSPSRGSVAQLGDPLDARTQSARPASRPDESAVAAAITHAPPAQAGRPDESQVAAAIGK